MEAVDPGQAVRPAQDTHGTRYRPGWAGYDRMLCQDGWPQHKPVWKRDLSTSGGMATAQLKIPAIPPANSMLGMLSSLWLHQKTDKCLRGCFPTEQTERKEQILTFSLVE